MGTNTILVMWPRPCLETFVPPNSWKFYLQIGFNQPCDSKNDVKKNDDGLRMDNKSLAIW